MGRGLGVTPVLVFAHRGKCSVTLLNETDILGQYLEKEVSSLCVCVAQNGSGGDFGGLHTLLKPLHTLLRPPNVPPPHRIVSSTRWCSTPCRKRCWRTRARSGWAASTRLRSLNAWLKVWGVLGRVWGVQDEGGHFKSPPKPPPGESDNRNQQKMEMKVWDPDNPLTDRQIDQFLVVAR